MALPEYLFMCCLFLVLCLSPNSAHRVLVGSIGSASVDSTYSGKLAEEAHEDHELIGVLSEPVPSVAVKISSDKALIVPISSVVGETEIIKLRTNHDLDIDNVHRKAITKPVLGVCNDEACLEPKSFTVSDSEFIDPPANPDPDFNIAHIKTLTKPRLSLSDNEEGVKPKSLITSDSAFIRPLNNPHSSIDKTHSKLMMRPSLGISNGKAPNRFSGGDSEFIKSPTNPVLIIKKAHSEHTTMPVLSIFDEAHREPISFANEARRGAHGFSEVTTVASNRHVSLAKSGDTDFAVTKDGSEGPFLPSPDCCYPKNALDANNKSPEQPIAAIDKNRVH